MSQGRFVVNRSGVSIPIWEWFTMGTCPNCQFDKRNRIGDIDVNEFYNRVTGVSCSQCVSAGRNITGDRIFSQQPGWPPLNVRQGFLHGDQIQANYARSILNFSLGTVNIGGTSFRLYGIQNRAAELRARTETDPTFPPLLGSLPVDTFIATNSDVMGVNFPTNWLIEWVRRGGVWTRADNRSGHNTFAFVDTGIGRTGAWNPTPARISIKTMGIT